MNKARLNYWLGWLLFLTGAGLAVSGFVRWLVLPGAGRGRSRGAEAVFIFTRHTWTDIHQWLALIFAGLVLLHLYLHWNWIVVITRHVLGRDKG